MIASVKEQINPPVSQRPMEFNDIKVSNFTEKKSGADNPNNINFADLLTSSNEAKKEERIATDAKDYSKLNQEEFLETLQKESQPKRVPKNTLDKDDFMKLFVAQLQHQDPLNPDDGAEMASKLAQFNSLEQMMNSNKNLQTLIDAQKAGQSYQMLNYVGKSVKLDGGFLKIKDSKIEAPSFDFPVYVSAATLVVRNQSGVKVAEVDLGSMTKGQKTLGWQPVSADGKSMPDGNYGFAIKAKSITGQDLDIPLSTNTKITGIDLKDLDKGLFTEFGKMGIKELSAVGDAQDIVAEKPISALPKAPLQTNPSGELEATGPAELPGLGEALPLNPVEKAQVSPHGAVNNEVQQGLSPLASSSQQFSPAIAAPQIQPDI